MDGEYIDVPQDSLINAGILYDDIETTPQYKLVSGYQFTQLHAAKEMIRWVKEHHPEALIVGSTIAAKAYPEDVVSPVPLQRRENRSSNRRIQRSDRFITFRKKKTNNG